MTSGKSGRKQRLMLGLSRSYLRSQTRSLLRLLRDRTAKSESLKTLAFTVYFLTLSGVWQAPTSVRTIIVSLLPSEGSTASRPDRHHETYMRRFNHPHVLAERFPPASPHTASCLKIARLLLYTIASLKILVPNRFPITGIHDIHESKILCLIRQELGLKFHIITELRQIGVLHIGVYTDSCTRGSCC